LLHRFFNGFLTSEPYGAKPGFVAMPDSGKNKKLLVLAKGYRFVMFRFSILYTIILAKSKFPENDKSE